VSDLLLRYPCTAGVWDLDCFEYQFLLKKTNNQLWNIVAL
jgi:hypothetical protein